jgi:hypothetical protein
VVSGSQDSPPIEGQLITYTCPPGFILTGPNMSVCMGNREWEPDPGEVDCIGNYLFLMQYIRPGQAKFISRLKIAHSDSYSTIIIAENYFEFCCRCTGQYNNIIILWQLHACPSLFPFGVYKPLTLYYYT